MRGRSLTSENVQFQHELKESLPADAKALVNRYDEVEAEQDGIMMVAMYRQGFLDGVHAAKVFGGL